MIGQKLGHYLILAKIGAGGMGEVYRAHDEQLDRDVALKVLPAGTLTDEAAGKQFRKEALALAKLNHPNIETVYEFASQDGVDFLAMELIPGHTLNEKIKLGPLPQTEIVRLALQLCAGLAAAHEQGIIHCDLKPHNLFVTPDERLKILDFGLAKRLHSEVAGEATRSVTIDTGTVSGTLPYMSPEQLGGAATDARTDIYSAGAVLYEMATGQRAFPQTQGPQLMGAILHQEPVPPISLNLLISPGLDVIVRKSMEKNAAQRYQTARELSVALESLAAGSATVVAVQDRLPAERISKRAKWTAGVTVAVLIGIGAAWGLNLGGIRGRVPSLDRARIDPPRAGIPQPPSQIRPAVAVIGFKNLSGRTDEAWLSTALSEMLTTEVSAGGKVRTIPGETVAQLKTNLALSDADSYGAATLQRIRASVGSEYVLLGSYLALGNGRVRLDLRLQNTQTGELLSSMSDEESEAEIAGLVSHMGAGIRTKLGAGDIKAADAEFIQAALPANPEAARLYSEAIVSLRNYDNVAARMLLEKSIVREPKFAQSHMVMSRVWSNLGYEGKANAEAKLAFDLSGNLSRREQLSIEGRYRETVRDWDKAIEIYKTLWNDYPDETAPGLSLATAQVSAAQLKDAQATVDALRNLHASGLDEIQIDTADARIAQAQGNFKRLLEIAQRNAAKAQALGARTLEADMLILENRAYEFLGDLKKSQLAAEQAKDLYAAAGDEGGVARALNALANSYANQGNNEQAQRMYEQALTIARRIGKKQEEAVVLHNLAILLRDHGELIAAKKMYQDSLAIDREVGNKIGEAETLNSWANVESNLGNSSAAEQLYTEGLAMAQAIGDRPIEALTSNNLADLFYGRGDPRRAQKMYESAQAIYRQMGDKDGVAMTSINIGAVLADQGDLNGGKTHTAEAVALAGETGNKSIEATALLGLGQVQWDAGDLVAARKTLEQSLAIRNELGEKNGATETETMLAQLALDENNASQSSDLASKASAEAHREKALDLEAAALAILAQSDLKLNKLTDARDAINKAKSLTSKSDERHVITTVAIAGARVTAAAGKADEALKTLQELLTEINKLDLVDLQFEARLAIGEIEAKSGEAAAGRAHLNALEKDATAKGFLLVARKCQSATS